MALFSDVDWVIIAVVAAFLLFGRQGQSLVRELGRWYGRFLRLKEEIMREIASPVESLRASVATDEMATVPREQVVTNASDPRLVPPSPSYPGCLTHVQPVGMWAVGTESYGAGMGVGTWWMSTTSCPGEVVRLR